MLRKHAFRSAIPPPLANAQYLEDELKRIGYQAWQNDYSNTVYFTRPNDAIMEKYILAPEYDARLGGKLAHIVVVQHTTRAFIDNLISDLKAAGVPDASSLMKKDEKKQPRHWH